MKSHINVFALVLGVVQAMGVAAQATTHIVQVAPGGSLMFSPSSLTAAAGDMIEFQFESNNHSVAQAAFNSPCQPLTGGIWSGFVITTAPAATTAASTTTKQANPGYKRQVSAPTFTIVVNNTNPAFFYCAQISHCQLGMVFALNPNSTETLSAFQSAASMATTVIPSGGGPQGGVLSTSSTPSTATASSTPSATHASSASAVKFDFAALFAALWGMFFFI